MTTPDATPKPPRPWGRVLFGLSLALNVAFIGAILGAGFLHRHRDWHGDRLDIVVDRVLASLPAAKRDAIKTMLREHRGQMRGNLDALRASKKALKEALLAKDFDPAQVRTAALPLLKLRGERQAGQVELLVRIFEGLSLDERRGLLESRFFRRLLDDRDSRRPDGPPPPPLPEQ